MKKYYVNINAQDTANRAHEVHKEGCAHLPDQSNLECLGKFNNCLDAVIEASKCYNPVNGCKYCCAPCHTI